MYIALMHNGLGPKPVAEQVALPRLCAFAMLESISGTQFDHRVAHFSPTVYIPRHSATILLHVSVPIL